MFRHFHDGGTQRYSRADRPCPRLPRRAEPSRPITCEPDRIAQRPAGSEPHACRGPARLGAG